MKTKEEKTAVTFLKILKLSSMCNRLANKVCLELLSEKKKKKEKKTLIEITISNGKYNCRSTLKIGHLETTKV